MVKVYYILLMEIGFKDILRKILFKDLVYIVGVIMGVWFKGFGGKIGKFCEILWRLYCKYIGIYR